MSKEEQKQAPTPGPFYFDEVDDGHFGIWSEETGALIAITQTGVHEPFTANKTITPEEESANAALIVKALNL